MATKPDGSIVIQISLDQSEFDKNVSNLGTKAAKAAAAIAAAVGTVSIAAIKMGADFEEGMSKVEAISGATGEDLEKLKEKAMEMGAKTKFSATEASEALQYMAMAGWKTEDMLNGLEGIMDLAAASGEDLALTSDIVTDALTAFGLSAQDSTRFADVLAAASSNANTNVSLMGETFKYVAPVAGALGYSIEDTAVAIGLMANSGIKGSEAGTALRAILSRLTKPTDEVAAAMSALNISLTNSDGTMKSFNDIIIDLRNSFSKLDQAQQAEMAATLGGQEAMSALLSIVNASDSDFQKLTNAIDNSSGSAKKMAETMNNNLKGKLDAIGSTLEGIGIKAYDKFEKPMSKALDSAQLSLEKLDKSMSSGRLGKSVDKLAIGFGQLVEVTINLATTALPLAIDTFALLADNSELIIGAITGISSAMLVYNNYQQISNALSTAGAVASLAYGTAQSVMTGELTAAAGAQEMLNLAMNANPAVLVTAGIVGLTAAIGALSLIHGEEKTRAQELNEELEAEAESFREVQKAAQEAGEAKLVEINNIQSMKDELDLLVDANGKVKEGFEDRANYLTGKLAEATGIDIKMTGNQIENYKDLSEEIQNTINQMKAQAILEAHQDEYTEALEKREGALKKLNEAQQAYNNATKDSQKWINEYRKSINDTSLTEEQRTQRAQQAYSAYVETQKENLDKAQENYNNYNQVIAGYQQAEMELQQGKTENVCDLLNQESSAYAKNAEDKVAAYSQEIADLQSYIESQQQIRTEANAQTVDAEIAASQKSIENKRNEMQQLVAEVVTASPKYSEALINMVSNGEIVFNDNGNLTEAAQKKFVDVFTTQNNLAPEYSKILTNMANNGKAVFDNNGNLTEAAQKKIIDAYAKANDLAPKYVNKLKEMAEDGENVFDASGNLTEDARKKISEAIQGADSKKGEFNTTLSSVAKEGEKGFKNGGDFWSAGSNAVSGIVGAANSGKNSVWGAFSRLASNALSAFNQKLGIHSPSREFIKATLYAVQGIQKSAQDNAHLATGEFENIADDILETFDDVSFDQLLNSFETSEIDKMAEKIKSAVRFEQQRMNSSVEVKGRYEIEKAMAELKQSDRPIRGILKGNITVVTNIDGREAAITLAPLVSEEIEFNS